MVDIIPGIRRWTPVVPGVPPKTPFIFLTRLDEAERKVERLREENSQLREQLRQLASENEQLKDTGTSDTHGFSALWTILEDVDLGPDRRLILPPSLSSDDARFARFLGELWRFALTHESLMNTILFTAKYGLHADTSTRPELTSALDRSRMACTREEEEALDGLSALLDRNARFIVDLHAARGASIFVGSRAMLKELDPKRHLAEAGGQVELAWESCNRKYETLRNPHEDDLEQDYFFKPWREKLRDYWDTRS